VTVFSNPIGKGLTSERVDMGADYGGSGPLYAIADGTIVNLYNSGWGPPNGSSPGAFLVLHLDSGQYMYYAEGVNPSVKIGDKVKAGQQIATANGGGIEVGWAEPPGTGNALGASQFNGNNATAYGKLMSDVIAAAGGPPGIVSGTVSGTVPSSFGITAKGVTPGGDSPGSGGGSLLGDVAGLTSIGSAISGMAKDFDNVSTAFSHLIDPGFWFRIAAFIVGTALLGLAIFVLVKGAGGDIPTPTVVPIPI
jgi:Peptidase family M23